MKTSLYKIMTLWLLSLFAATVARADGTVIRIQQIAFDDEELVEIDYLQSSISVRVSYTPTSIPHNPDYYIDEINNYLGNEYYIDLTVEQISPSEITFLILENPNAEDRIYIIQGNTSKTLTITQAGNPNAGGGGEDTPTDVKFNIPGNWILKRIYTNATAVALV